MVRIQVFFFKWVIYFQHLYYKNYVEKRGWVQTVYEDGVMDPDRWSKDGESRLLYGAYMIEKNKTKRR